MTPLTHWRLPSRSPFLRFSDRTTEPRAVTRAWGAGATYRERGGGLLGGMASGGGSLGLIACLLLFQSELWEAWAAAAVYSTSDFFSGPSETPRVDPLSPMQVQVTRMAHQDRSSPFKPFSFGNLRRGVFGKERAVSRPRVGVSDTLNSRDVGSARAIVGQSLVALPVASEGNVTANGECVTPHLGGCAAPLVPAGHT